MITEEEIQQKAEEYASNKWIKDSQIEYTCEEDVCWIQTKDDYIVGYKQCQQDMLNGNVLIGQMEYNRLQRDVEEYRQYKSTCKTVDK